MTGEQQRVEQGPDPRRRREPESGIERQRRIRIPHPPVAVREERIAREQDAVVAPEDDAALRVSGHMNDFEAGDGLPAAEEDVRGGPFEPEQQLDRGHRQAALRRSLLTGQDRRIERVDRDLRARPALQLGRAADVIDVPVGQDDVAEVGGSAPDPLDGREDLLRAPRSPAVDQEQPISDPHEIRVADPQSLDPVDAVGDPHASIMLGEGPRHPGRVGVRTRV